MNLEEDKEYLVDPELLEAEDRWILSTLNETARNVNRNLDRFEIGLAAAELYDFIWFRFCDWYIEFVKPRLYGEDARRRDTALGVLMQCIASIVKLLHPFMPFITEEIWQTLPFTKGKAIHAEYPQYDPKMDFSEDVESIEMVISAITAIRNERQQRNIAPSKKSKIVLYSSDASVRKQLQALAYEFENLASASEVQVVEQDPKPEDAAQIIQDKLKIYLPLKGLIDYNEELKKLAKELENAQNEIARAEKKLANPGFSAKAPENVINKEKEKIASYSGMIPELEKAIADVRKMIEN